MENQSELILDKLCDFRLPSELIRVLLSIYNLKHLGTPITPIKIADRSKMVISNVSRAINKLLQLNIIHKIEVKNYVSYCVNYSYDEWKDYDIIINNDNNKGIFGDKSNDNNDLNGLIINRGKIIINADNENSDHKGLPKKGNLKHFSRIYSISGKDDGEFKAFRLIDKYANELMDYFIEKKCNVNNVPKFVFNGIWRKANYNDTIEILNHNTDIEQWKKIIDSMVEDEFWGGVSTKMIHVLKYSPKYYTTGSMQKKKDDKDFKKKMRILLHREAKVRLSNKTSDIPNPELDKYFDEFGVKEQYIKEFDLRPERSRLYNNDYA